MIHTWRNLCVILMMSVTFTASAQQKDSALAALLSEKDPVALEQKLTALGSGNEESLDLLSQYYYYKRLIKQYDSIKQIAIKKYPKGRMAAEDAVMQIYKETDLHKKEALLARYKKDFPGRDLDQAYAGMVYTLVKTKETAKEGIKYFNMIKGKHTRLINAYHAGVNIAARDPRLAEPFLQRELQEFSNVANEPDDSAHRQDKMLYREMEYAYGVILYNKGSYRAALPYIRTAYEHASPRDVDKKVQYARLMIRLKNYKEAFPVLDKVVRDGKGNARLKQELVESYNKVNPGGDGAAYVAGIEKEIKAQIAKDFLKNVMNKPAPAFAVKDVNGKTVSLSDFKGKTIVLDFWATWCGPCKRSFPAMQMVVNKYKNDPDVKFLFIDTWEKSKTPLKNAQAYLKAHHYDFDLYMDPPTGDNNNKAALLFGFEGIPQKYVIDGKGNIRFNITGFGGGDDAAVEELSYMIDYAKKNS